MAVTYVTLYPPGGNSTTVQVVEGSQLHMIYADMGFSATPSAPGPPKRPDPFPQYVHDDEVADLLADAAVPATDPVVADLVSNSSSATGVALRTAFVGAVTPQAHGAVAGNVVDCTAAINAALATQKAVLIPEGDYKISGTIRCNRNGVILTTGRVRLIVTVGAVLDPILESDDTPSGKTVVFDHSRLSRGVVFPIQVVGNGATNTVAFAGSQSTDTTVEPNNTFIKPTASGCEWAIWGTFDGLPVAGYLTGNHYIDLSSSCANGVCIQQNQDDVTFSGSTRIRSVTGVAVQKTAGVSLDMGNVYIGLQDGAVGVDLGNYANSVKFGHLFIEAEPGATSVEPIVMDGIGISSPPVTASLTVSRLSVNAPDGTTWIKMLGRYDHLNLASVASLDYNGARPNSKLVELVYGDQQDTHQTGTINYDGAYDERVIARPDQPWPWQLNDTSAFHVTANNSVLGVQRGVTLYDYGDIDTIALIPLLINAAAGVGTRDPLAQRGVGNVVRLEGAINKTNAAEDAVVAFLPVGYRPITSRTYPIAGVSGGTLNVRSDGVITVSPTATTGTISLDGVTYQAVRI